jgi:hypothetical protein
VRLSRARNDGVVPSINQKIVGSILVPQLSRRDQDVVVSKLAQVEAGQKAVHSHISRSSQLKSSLAQLLLAQS